MTISYATLDFIEGGVISAVIILNIVVGFLQDYRAEQTIQSLLAMAAPACKVIRDGGTVSTIRADELVPGDIVQLGVGDVVPADIRLFSSINLATDEALLTGESKPSTKDANAVLDESDAPIGDRVNIVYSSTTITRGRGIGIVTATGMQTEIGKIAQLLRAKRDDPGENRSLLVRTAKRVLQSIKNGLGLIGTPLQVKLSWFALLLFALAILLAVIVFSVNLWELDDETLIYGICVAVAVIPESLIAVLTITMSVGSKAMARGNVIVRKMGKHTSLKLQKVSIVIGTHYGSESTLTLYIKRCLRSHRWCNQHLFGQNRDTHSRQDARQTSLVAQRQDNLG